MPTGGHDDPRGFVVSIRDVYDAVTRLTTAVDRMAGQRDTLVDHETRLRGLERWRYALPTSLLLAAGSVVLAVVTAVWKG